MIQTLSILAMLLTADPAEDRLEVQINGLRGHRGSVVCLLFSGPDNFPKLSAAVATVKTSASSPPGCSFTGLKPGTYAVTVFHDEDENGKLSANFIGIPSEGHGTSNDAKASFGPPPFKDAAVVYRGAVQSVPITLHY